MRGSGDTRKILVITRVSYSRTAGWFLSALNLSFYRPTNDQVGYIADPPIEFLNTLLRNSLAAREVGLWALELVGSPMSRDLS